MWSNTSSYSASAVADAIRASVASGDYTGVREVYDYMLEASTAADPAKSIRSALATAFRDEYITLIDERDTAGAAALAKALASIVGIEQEDMDKWVLDEKAEIMRESIDTGDDYVANMYIRRQIELGREPGAIAQSITARYKPLIVAGGENAAALRETLLALDLRKEDGTRYYTPQVIQEWINNAK